MMKTLKRKTHGGFEPAHRRLNWTLSDDLHLSVILLSICWEVTIRLKQISLRDHIVLRKYVFYC